VNFNGGDRVLRAVDALMRQRYPFAEIVVVDNGSSDGSPARICTAFPTVRLIQQETNEGLPRARNVGLAALQTTLAFVVDHDIYADERCVEAMVRAYVAEHPAVVCPRIRLLPDRDIVQVEGASPHFLGTLVLRHGYQSVLDTPADPCEVDGCTGGCMLVHRECIIDAGGFDESFFFYLEDLEFSLRLRGRGLRFWCEPVAEVFHEPASGTPGLAFRGRGSYPARRAYYTMRNRLQVVLIHYRCRTLLVMSPVLALYELATFVTALKKGWPAQWLRAWSWQIRNVRSVIARRRVVQSRRTVADRDLLVGGRPPLAPGFVTSRIEDRLLQLFSGLVNGYWSLARRWVG
jgi:GT2 family glycosyltransferase